MLTGKHERILSCHMLTGKHECVYDGTSPLLGRLIGSFLGPSATTLLAGSQAFRYVASPLISVQSIRLWYITSPRLVDRQLFRSVRKTLLAGRQAFRYVAFPLISLKVFDYGTSPPLCRLIGSFLGPSATTLLSGRQAFRYVASL